jgi:hypothetical protein
MIESSPLGDGGFTSQPKRQICQDKESNIRVCLDLFPSEKKINTLVFFKEK